ncbi:MAG: sporulation protein YabP [Clostridia bacterium]|nr:sporulation protein YabP [Clostridia bacterium]
MQTEERKGLPQTLHMEDRKRLTLTGVIEVGNFDDTSVVLFLRDGKLTVHGNGLKIGLLSVETGEVQLEGLVHSLQYSDAKPGAKGFWAKVLR